MTVAELTRVEGQAALASPVAPILARLAGGLAALTIVTYQTWFMPFFQPFFAGKEWLARPVFYALYGSVLLAAAAVLATAPAVRRKVFPYAVVAAFAIAAAALHPVGLVARAYIIALVLGGATAVLMLGSVPRALLRVSASATAFNAVVCLIDILFANGFTNTAGRAAGLAINPNDAAAGLLLGAAATYRAVPERLRPSFLVLVGTALAVTLSRSTILAAALALAVTVFVAIWRRWRHRSTFRMPTGGLGLAGATGVVLAAWIALTFASNDRFQLALKGAAKDLWAAEDALRVATAAVDAAAQDTPGEDVILASTAAPAALPEPATANKIEALGNRLAGEGQRNSIAARTLFLERALLVYLSNGPFGIGLEKAQQFAPHNTFLFFAIAFGHVGWLIPLAVIGAIIFSGANGQSVPLAVAAFVTMLTSHDILVTPSLFLPIAIGIAGLLARGEDPALARAYPSVAFGMVGGAALFVLGCVAILLFAPRLAVLQLQPRMIGADRGAYLALLAPPAFPGIFHFAEASATPAENSLYLHEGSAALTRVESSPGQMPALGLGQFAVRGSDTLVFATSDRSDPKINGREYEVGLPLTVSPLCYALLATILLWCVTTVVTLFRSPPPADGRS